MGNTYKYILAFSFLILFITFILGKTGYNAVPEMLYNPQNNTTSEKPQNQNGDKKTRYPVKKTQVESYEDIGKKSPIDLRDPSNVKTEVVYDTQNNCYILRTKVGDEVIETPYLMDSGEYMEYTRKRQMADYFRLKNNELAQKGEKQGDDFSLKDIRVNLGPAEKIFGPGGVRIKTQGSIELSSGIKRTSIDNPALSQNSRTKTLFDFDEKIQLRANASVGDKMNFNLNYDTQATFDFDSKKVKLAYEGKEDEIVRHLEAGNVSMTTSNSLINGGASLFGIKADLQFGKLKVNTVIAQQESQTKSVNSKGGVQTTPFEVSVDQYDANQHFFLNEYFRDIYEKSMSSLPYVKSGITINRIEVWVTNKRGNYDQARNVVAFADMGERNHIHNSVWSAETSDPQPQNNANNLYSTIKSSYPAARDISQVTATFSGVLASGQDYEKMESARLMSSSEYIVNAKLGYISLKSKLQSDEVLAVAYEYKLDGNTYQVGEFAADVSASYSSGGDNPATASGALFLKLVKPASLSPNSYLWNLMMKNVYSLGSSQIQSTNFLMNIAYQNDTTGTTYVNYLSEGKIAGKQLLKVMNLDRLDSKQNANPDGKFDFIDGYTVIPSLGRIVFPSLEPFGSFLRTKFDNDKIAEKYVFQELYDSTQIVAKQHSERNKFKLIGSYQGSSSAIISLNATNVARGSVVVMAGGARLTEGSDYTVDYISGTVTIINQSIIDAGSNVSVSLEDQSLFSTQRKTLTGLNLSYEFSKNFNIGATIMHLSEMPLTTKTAFGNESVNNTLFGFNLSYTGKSDWLTNLVDKLPFVNATQPSQITFTGEFAQLIAGHAKNKYGNYSYLDDFESTKSAIDIMTPSLWSLASTPYDNSSRGLFPEAGLSNNIDYGKNRALLSWFSVARLFTQRNSSATPQHIKNDKDQLSNHFVRQINESEIYPNRTIPTTDVSTISAFNLSFYPTQRGPYNLDATNIGLDGSLNNPTKRWGGIMRKLETTDFETANIGYIEFWMLDPFVYDTTATQRANAGGDLYFNLGNVSEDILKDGKKFFENGLPINGDASAVEETVWGKVPKRQSTVIAFDDSNGAASRKLQDVGLNGLSTQEEFTFSTYANYLAALRQKLSPEAIARMESDPFSPLNDPGGDKYHFYRGSDYDQQQLSILDRYKYYNGTEGNSVSDEDSPESYSTAAKSTPDVEDINNDNTLNETESYYQYKVELRPGKMEVGSNFITDSRKVRVNLPNGNEEDVTWYQFKIPIAEYQKPVVGNIDGFNSIRFIRMFMTNFSKTTFLRFATLELVKNEWREYKNSLISNGSATGNGSIDINAVNIEENGEDRTPVSYVLPPGVTRSTDASQSQVIEQNEQAMSLKVKTLDPNDSRAAYKTVNYDLRKYKRLQMFAHAEELADGPTLSKGDMSVFIRFGTDYRNNYYEYEIPLTITPPGRYRNNNASDRDIVWPANNMFDFPLELLKEIKLNRNKAMNSGAEGVSYSNLYYEYDPDKPNNRVSVSGNPSLGEIKVMMVGVRNRSTSQRSVEVWVNELRLDDFNDDGGWAAKAYLNIALSDLGTINISGRKETDGFGALDQGLQSRRDNTYDNINISTNFELGRFLPEQLKLSAPFYYNYSKETTMPKYNVYDSDVSMKEALATLLGKQQRDSLVDLNRTQTITKGLAFNNIKFNIKSKVPMPYDPANFSFSYSSNETKSMNPTTNYDSRQNMKMSVSYSYSPIAKSWTPFKGNKGKSAIIKSLQQFSFNYLPTNVAFNSYLQRNYEEVKLRNLDSYASESYSSDLLSWSQDFYWNRDAYLTWDLTKNLKLDFQSSTKAEVEEPYTQVNKKDNPVAYEAWKDSVIRSILHFGKPLAYQQNLKLTYNVPFSYFPATNWITSAASYEGAYSWTRASVIQATDEEEDLNLGNTISNTKSFSLNSRFNLLTLYNKSTFLKKVNQKFEASTRPRENQSNQSRRNAQQQNPIDKKRKFEANVVLKMDTTVTVRHNLNSKNVKLTTRSQGKVYPVKFKRIDNNSLQILTKDTVRLQVVVVKGPDPEETAWYKVAQYASRGLMSMRSLTLNYSLQSGSTITGFLPNIGDFIGQGKSDFGMAPGWGYAFGLETGLDFVQRSRNNNWLVMDQTDINPALLTRTEKMDVRAQLEPIKGLKVDLEAQRSITRNTQVEYMYSRMPRTFSGSYSITTISLATSLKSVGSKNGYYSNAFETFLNNRSVIAGRYNDEYSQLLSGRSNVDQLGESPLNSSDVLIPAFLAAYSGKSAKKVALTQFPSLSSLLPNWKMTYDGLISLPWVRDKFKSLRVSHGYSSLYQVGSYSSYAGWTELSDDRGYIQSVLTGSYLPSSPYDISSVTITEKFTPLIGFDGTLNNNLTFSMKYNNARTVTLSTSSYQIVEALSNELIVGMSHKIPEFNKVLGISTKAKGINNDLDIKADFSHKTIYALLRKIEDVYSQATSGTTINSLKVSAAYTLSRSLTLGAYLDQIMNKPLVSATSYKTTTTNFGVSLKFNLTQ